MGSIYVFYNSLLKELTEKLFFSENGYKEYQCIYNNLVGF